MEGNKSSNMVVIFEILLLSLRRLTQCLHRLVLGFTLLFPSVGFTSNEFAVPKHLLLGRTLVATLSSDDTSYKYHGWFRWNDGSAVTRYEAHTDCSGLMNELLERAENRSIDRLRATASRRRPRAKDYYALISRQDGFKRIDALTDVLPGDIIAVKYPPGMTDTGHVMLIDTLPIAGRTNTEPFIEGTKQWEVTVIDASKSPHGRVDTRYAKDGTKHNGVGRGTIRLYLDADGKLAGYTWSTARVSKFYDVGTRPIAIGRTR